MKQILALSLVVVFGLTYTPAHSLADEEASAAKIKELTAKCKKGDQHACTELEFLQD